jgi:hypothetical protein
VTRRPGMSPVLSWTKTCRLLLMKLEKNDRSTTFGPISSLQRNHLDPAANIGQQQTKKHISPDLKTDEKTKLPITCCHQPRGTAVKVDADVGVEVRQIYSSGHRFHHPTMHHNLLDGGTRPPSHLSLERLRERARTLLQILGGSFREVVPPLVRNDTFVRVRLASPSPVATYHHSCVSKFPARLPAVFACTCRLAFSSHQNLVLEFFILPYLISLGKIGEREILERVHSENLPSYRQD